MADVALATQHDERADSRHCLICTNYLDAGSLVGKQHLRGIRLNHISKDAADSTN